jgi:hypothetical protein
LWAGKAEYSAVNITFKVVGFEGTGVEAWYDDDVWKEKQESVQIVIREVLRRCHEWRYIIPDIPCEQLYATVQEQNPIVTARP